MACIYIQNVFDFQKPRHLGTFFFRVSRVPPREAARRGSKRFSSQEHRYRSRFPFRLSLVKYTTILRYFPPAFFKVNGPLRVSPSTKNGLFRKQISLPKMLPPPQCMLPLSCSRTHSPFHADPSLTPTPRSPLHSHALVLSLYNRIFFLIIVNISIANSYISHFLRERTMLYHEIDDHRNTHTLTLSFSRALAQLSVLSSFSLAHFHSLSLALLTVRMLSFPFTQKLNLSRHSSVHKASREM